ncbi:hypothetical protein [Paracoccus sp. MC1854]|nr:hypothetical protein [Paracoccus sp. MC1854]
MVEVVALKQGTAVGRELAGAPDASMSLMSLWKAVISQPVSAP